MTILLARFSERSSDVRSHRRTRDNVYYHVLRPLFKRVGDGLAGNMSYGPWLLIEYSEKMFSHPQVRSHIHILCLMLRDLRKIADALLEGKKTRKVIQALLIRSTLSLSSLPQHLH